MHVNFILFITNGCEKGITMSHKNKVPMVDQVKQELDRKLVIGRSKHQDRLSEKKSHQTIFIVGVSTEDI